MNTLQIEDVFEPYYVGRKPFLAPKPAERKDAGPKVPARDAGAESDSSPAKPDIVTEH